MFNKILIANRGEIACRVARTAHKMGIKTAGVYSEADKYAQHASLVDQAYLIGPPAPTQSYLFAPHIIEVAKHSRSEAIHPGYGFLSENADFVESLEQANLTFIGPPASAIRSMGSKSESKKIMYKAGVPILSGYHGDNQEPEYLLKEAKRIGFPVMLKASLGGGGKGMRICENEGEFFEMLEAAKREAKKGFNDEHMLIEKYVQKPRHIEVQVFGDKHGNYVHLNERDCTVQRRHQKVVEEGPSHISAALRSQIGEAAKAAAQAVGYYNAGTVEFIFDTETDKFYFMEMNTRLQVEHPVTEMITGQDLVEWQIRVANGQKLPILDQKHVPLIGHSIEARIYAEDPDNGFLPQSGKISVLREPTAIKGQVRVDTGIVEGDTITTWYDPMISKLIVHAPTRSHAIQRMNQALQDYKVIGLPTNIKFLKRVLRNTQFQEGEFDTSFIEQNSEELLKPSKELSHIRKGTVAVVKTYLESLEFRTKHRNSSNDPWAIRDNFRLNYVPQREHILIDNDDNEHRIFVEYLGENRFNAYHRDENDFLTSLLLNAEVILNETKTDEVIVRTDSEQYKVNYYIDEDDNITQIDYEGAPLEWRVKPRSLEKEESETPQIVNFVKSPMPGTVVKVFVEAGQAVTAGTPLCSVESMKMEYLIKATHDQVVDQVNVKEGEFVQMKQKLIEFQ